MTTFMGNTTNGAAFTTAKTHATVAAGSAFARASTALTGAATRASTAVAMVSEPFDTVFLTNNLLKISVTITRRIKIMGHKPMGIRTILRIDVFYPALKNLLSI